MRLGARVWVWVWVLQRRDDLAVGFWVDLSGMEKRCFGVSHTSSVAFLSVI